MNRLHLRTPRLNVRAVRESDCPDIMERMASPDVTRYLTWDFGSWTDEAWVLGWLREQRTFELSVMDRFLEFAVTLGGRNIGDVGFRRVSHTPTLAEVGWVFAPDVRGRGYATEAAAALIDWCFRHLRVRRIIAVCDARNCASARLMERLGMRREAHHKKSRLVKGLWTDELVYAVLREEWSKRPAPVYSVLAPLPERWGAEPVDPETRLEEQTYREKDVA